MIKSKKPLLTILAIVLCCFVVIIIWCNIFPILSINQMEWKMYYRNVETEVPNYPLEVISDGYKMIRVYRVETGPRKVNEFPFENIVEWGWKMTIKNKSYEAVRVNIAYELLDKDSFVIASDKTPGYGYIIEEHLPETYIGAGKTSTIQHMSSIPHKKAQNVYGSKWHIKLK